MRRRHEAPLVLLLGLLFSLGLLEAGLRLAGQLRYPSPDVQDQANNAPDGSFKVLCVGDSFTAASGTIAWPSQLAELLNTEAASRPVTVINAGLGGTNTHLILKALPVWLDQAQPDLVILLAGTTNQTNYIGFHDYISSRSWTSRLDDWLFNLRIWRLLRYSKSKLTASNGAQALPQQGAEAHYQRLGVRFEQDYLPVPSPSLHDPHFAEGYALLQAGNVSKAKASFQAGMDSLPDEASNYMGMGIAAQDEASPREAIPWFEACLTRAPKDMECTFLLAMALASQPSGADRAEALFLSGIEKDTDMARHQVELARLFLRKGQMERAFTLLESCIESAPRDLSCYETLVRLDGLPAPLQKRVGEILERAAVNSEVAADWLARWREGSGSETTLSDWAREELDQMLVLLESRKIPVILHGYPSAFPMNRILRDLAQERALPYVDHASAIDARVRQGTPRPSLFVPDGHCTREGYGIMAADLAQEIRQGRYLHGRVSP